MKGNRRQLLEAIAQEVSWPCENCGDELTGHIRTEAIENFIAWGLDHWSLMADEQEPERLRQNVFAIYLESKWAGDHAIGRYYCSQECQEEKEAR